MMDVKAYECVIPSVRLDQICVNEVWKNAFIGWNKKKRIVEFLQGKLSVRYLLTGSDMVSVSQAAQACVGEIGKQEDRFLILPSSAWEMEDREERSRFLSELGGRVLPEGRTIFWLQDMDQIADQETLRGFLHMLSEKESRGNSVLCIATAADIEQVSSYVRSVFSMFILNTPSSREREGYLEAVLASPFQFEENFSMEELTDLTEGMEAAQLTAMVQGLKSYVAGLLAELPDGEKTEQLIAAEGIPISREMAESVIAAVCPKKEESNVTVEPGKAAETVISAEPSESAGSVKPAEPFGSVEIVKPAESSDPDEPVKPAESSGPDESVKSSKKVISLDPGGMIPEDINIEDLNVILGLKE